MTTLLIATRNAHKVGEMRAILGGNFLCLNLEEFPNAPQVIEDGKNFADNATKKSSELARWISRFVTSLRSTIPDFVLADDSGLEVDALGGQPGVRSARFAAADDHAVGNSSDTANNAKLLHLLQDVPPDRRTARFRCVLALTAVPAERLENASPVCYADESAFATSLFDGRCEGRILSAPSGAGGFGYDPLFVPDGAEHSFAELGEVVKNQISHRARALAKLKAHFGAVE